MYVDKVKMGPTAKTNVDKEVQDATAALKGMLGITGASSSFPTTTNATEPPASSSNQQQLPSKSKKKKKKKNQQTPPIQNNKKNQQKTPKRKNTEKKASENFAWSAFQSSPDASKLPIPAFSSSAEQVPPSSGNNSKNAKPVPDKAVHAEDIEDHLIAQAKSDQDDKREKEQQKNSSPSEAPVSKTGVNLAAAIQNNSSNTPTNSAPVPPPPPPGLAGQDPTAGKPNMFNATQPTPGPPNGYLTVQVQVPMALGPGRQMLVNTPSGYPVQVVVPQGIPPGAVIPVHVPAAPLHMMPPNAYPPQYYHPNQLR